MAWIDDIELSESTKKDFRDTKVMLGITNGDLARALGTTDANLRNSRAYPLIILTFLFAVNLSFKYLTRVLKREKTNIND